MPGHLLDRVAGAHGRFALTYDDGPSPTWTPRLLEVLASAGARATFFPLARNLRRHGALARTVVGAGHEYGVHGELHLPPPILPWAWFAWDVRQGVRAASAVAGRAPRWYRPPYDVLRPSQSARLRALGLLAVRGDIDPADYNQPGLERIVDRVVPRLAAGSIVVMHDSSGVFDLSRRQSVEASARILAAARERGLQSVTLSELLASPGAEPDVDWALPSA